MFSPSVSWQWILTQEMSLQITMKSSCHFLLNHLGKWTLQNSTQFSNANSLSLIRCTTGISWSEFSTELPKSKSKLCYDRRSVGQSVLVSSTHLALTTKFLLLSDRCGFFKWGALSDERTGLPFTIAADPRQRSHSRSESLGTRDHILLSQIRDSPNLEGQVPV
jgi:hypothetical protein